MAAATPEELQARAQELMMGPPTPVPTSVPAPVAVQPPAPVTQPQVVEGPAQPVYVSQDVSTPGIQQAINANAQGSADDAAGAANARADAALSKIIHDGKVDEAALHTLVEAQPEQDRLRHFDEATEHYLQDANEKQLKESEDSLARKRKLLDEDPTDFWGHASTAAKVSAVLSVIGAGLGGRDPNAVVDRLVNEGVQNHARRMDMEDKYLGAVQGHQEQIRRYAQSRTLASQEHRLAIQEGLANKLKQAELSAPDAQTKARYAEVNAVLQTEIAKGRDELRKGVLEHTLKTAQLSVDREKNANTWRIAQLNNSTDLEKTNVAANNAGKNKTVSVTGFHANADKEIYSTHVQKQDVAAQTAVSNLAEIRRDYERRDYAAAQTHVALLETQLRNLSDSGAALSEEEIKRFIAPLSAGLSDLAKGGLFKNFNLHKKIDTIEEGIVDKLYNAVRTTDPNAKIDVAGPYGDIHLRHEFRDIVEQLATSRNPQDNLLFDEAASDKPTSERAMALHPAAVAYKRYLEGDQPPRAPRIGDAPIATSRDLPVGY